MYIIPRHGGLDTVLAPVQGLPIAAVRISCACSSYGGQAVLRMLLRTAFSPVNLKGEDAMCGTRATPVRQLLL